MRVTSRRNPSPRHCALATQVLSKKCCSGGEQLATLCPIWPAWDSNLRPPAPETNALPLDQLAFWHYAMLFESALGHPLKEGETVDGFQTTSAKTLNINGFFSKKVCLKAAAYPKKSVTHLFLASRVNPKKIKKKKIGLCFGSLRDLLPVNLTLWGEVSDNIICPLPTLERWLNRGRWSLVSFKKFCPPLYEILKWHCSSVHLFRIRDQPVGRAVTCSSLERQIWD